MKPLFFVMAGGAGTRFWPLSTKDMPKQFLPIFNGKSLMEMTLDRIEAHFNRNDIYVLTRESYIEYIKNNYRIRPGNIIGEKYPRDTAASVAIAVYYSLKAEEDPVCVIMPSDHIIESPGDFYNDLRTIFNHLDTKEAVFTIGIKPSYPATGYGYLELAGKVSRDLLYRVSSFREKPDIAKARLYIESGNYLWNSGIFIFRAKTMAEYISRFLPSHDELRSVFESGDSLSELGRILYDLPKISIDYAVMEKLSNIYTLPASFSWNDMGGWISLKDFLNCDKSGNYFNHKPHLHNSSGNIVYSSDKGQEIVMLGVNDLVVVRAGNRTLIINKEQMEELKKVTEIFT